MSTTETMPATNPAGRRVKCDAGYRFDRAAIHRTSAGVGDPDDFVRLLNKRGAAKVLITAAGPLWRCRAWHGANCFEATHASRAIAAAHVALAFVCGQHGLGDPVEESKSSE